MFCTKSYYSLFILAEIFALAIVIVSGRKRLVSAFRLVEDSWRTVFLDYIEVLCRGFIMLIPIGHHVRCCENQEFFLCYYYSLSCCWWAPYSSYGWRLKLFHQRFLTTFPDLTVTMSGRPTRSVRVQVCGLSCLSFQLFQNLCVTIHCTPLGYPL